VTAVQKESSNYYNTKSRLTVSNTDCMILINKQILLSMPLPHDDPVKYNNINKPRHKKRIFTFRSLGERAKTSYNMIR